MSNEEIISNNVEKMRLRYDIGKYPGDVKLMCNECALDCVQLADENGMLYSQISLTKLGISEPFHKASLLETFDENGNNIRYLVDPTYGQFFGDHYSGNSVFREYMFSNYSDFVNELLDKGYIECTLENIFYYIDGFVSSNAYVKDVDKESVYKNVERLLLERNVGYREFDDTIKKLIDLLYLKKELLKGMNKNIDNEKGISR